MPEEYAPKKKSNKVIIIIIIVILVVVVGPIVFCCGGPLLLAAFSDAPAKEARAEARVEAQVEAESKTEVSEISWEEIDAIYNVKSKKTDLQKDHFWKNYENKYVRWQGEVSDIGEGLLGGLRLSIKMNSSTFTSDLSIALKDSQKDKALQLSKGDTITFKGRLKRWGSLLPISLDKGEIE